MHLPGKASQQPQVLEVDIGIETVFSVVCRSTSRLSHKILLDISDILAKQSKGNTLNIAAVLDGIQILQFKVVHFEQLLDGYGDEDDNSEETTDNYFSVISSPLR